MNIAARLKALLILCICFVCFALVVFAGSIALTGTLNAQEAPLPAPKKPTSILINNARIFDGVSDEIRRGNLLIVGFLHNPSQRCIRELGSSILPRMHRSR